MENALFIDWLHRGTQERAVLCMSCGPTWAKLSRGHPHDTHKAISRLFRDLHSCMMSSSSSSSSKVNSSLSKICCREGNSMKYCSSSGGTDPSSHSPCQDHLDWGRLRETRNLPKRHRLLLVHCRLLLITGHTVCSTATRPDTQHSFSNELYEHDCSHTSAQASTLAQLAEDKLTPAPHVSPSFTLAAGVDLTVCWRPHEPHQM